MGITLLFFSICSVYLAAYLITATASISVAIATLASGIPYLLNKKKAEKLEKERDCAWPETLDSLVSALQSGIPIPEALCSLSLHAPENLRPLFASIKEGLENGEEFEPTLLAAKSMANSVIADQVFETLVYAKDFGGRDSNNALRLLAEFVREDLAVTEEIRTKFEWIRNSAILATVAPWLLLLLLASQASTREAFSTFAGFRVLATGVLLTGVAYAWMDRVGSLPRPYRALR